MPAITTVLWAGGSRGEEEDLPRSIPEAAVSFLPVPAQPSTGKNFWRSWEALTTPIFPIWRIWICPTGPESMDIITGTNRKLRCFISEAPQAVPAIIVLRFCILQEIMFI